MRRLLRRTAPAWLYILWTLLVLYPNPALLARSVPQSIHPVVDPEAVRHWADDLPDDPAYIEQQVLNTYVPYAVPWQSMGVPWYFPTTREVVEQGSGDCQGRALVLASILEAKGIPYKLQASFDHIWVEYPKKQPNRLENQDLAMMRNTGQGPELQMPKKWDWRETYRIEKEYFWDPMPLSRQVLLFGGLTTIALRRRIARAVQRTRAPNPAATPADA